MTDSFGISSSRAGWAGRDRLGNRRGRLAVKIPRVSGQNNRPYVLSSVVKIPRVSGRHSRPYVPLAMLPLIHPGARSSPWESISVDRRRMAA
jgi:hypothetical protein